MKPLSDTIACVVDKGLFVHIAQCLAAELKHVYYVGPSEHVMPRLADAIVGDGMENITRVPDLWTVKNDCDVFVFPDIGFRGEQRELKSQGLPVWGHGGSDELEVNKGLFVRTLLELDMPVAPLVIVDGLTELRAHLMDLEDKYVKVSRYRGDWETFHWRNRTLDEIALDCAAYRLGPAKDLLKFYVFDAIETDVEDGIDTYRVGGQWPKRVLHAMERKDKSLLGAIQDMADISEMVREVNEKFGPVLDNYGHNGAFSTEVRINDKAYFNDPTCRFGSPPSQLQTELIHNLPEIIVAGAHGECVEPVATDPVGAQVLVTTDREKDEWATLDFPSELRPHVKSAFACEIDGIFRIAPNPLENWAGWLVAIGEDVKDVIETLKHRKELLPDGFDCDLTSLCDLLKEMESAEQEGVTITDEIPEPESVVT